MKKIVLAFLTFMLIFANPTWASTIDNYSYLTKEDQVVIDRLGALGIMFGDGVGFNETGILTRAQAITIIARINNITDIQAEVEKNYSLFNDVPTGQWYTGYINIAKQKKITIGVGDNRFAPDREITYQEMLTMLVRTLGADKYVEMNGVWPANYISFALNERIIANINKNFSAPINRLETARLVSSVLESYIWIPKAASTNGSITYEKTDKTLIEERLDVNIYKSNDTRYGYTNTEYIIESLSYKDREIYIKGLGRKYAADFVDLTGLLAGMIVDVWADSYGDVIRIFESDSLKQNTIAFTSVSDFTNSSGDIDLVVDNRTKTYYVSSSTIIYVNGTEVQYKSLNYYLNTSDKMDGSSGRVILGKSNELAYLYIDQYDSAIVVSKVSNTKITAKSDIRGSSDEDIDLKNKEYVIKDEYGRQMLVEDINKNDTILYYYSSKNKYYNILVLRDNDVKGAVKAISSNYVTIGKTRYELNRLVSSSATSILSNIKIGDDITAYLDLSGEKVLMIATDSLYYGDLGVVTAARAYTSGYGEVTARLEITQLDGYKIKDVDLDITETEYAFGKTFFATTVNGLNNQLYVGTNPLLGSMIRFRTMNNNKIEIIEFEDTYGFGRYGSDGEEDMISLPNNYYLDIDSNRMTRSGDTTYRVASNTIVAVENVKGASYETSVDIIRWSELRNMTTGMNDVQVTIAGVDSSTNSVNCVYIRGNVTRNRSSNFGIIKVLQDAGSDTYEADIITSSGTTRSMTIEDSSINRNNLASYEGALICYSETGTRLVDPDIYKPTSANIKVAKVYNETSSTLRISENGETNKNNYIILDLSENVVYTTARYITEVGGNVAMASANVNGKTITAESKLKGSQYNGYSIILDPTSGQDILERSISNNEKTVTIKWKAGGNSTPSVNTIINEIQTLTYHVLCWDNINFSGGSVNTADITSIITLTLSGGQDVSSYTFSSLAETSDRPYHMSTNEAFETNTDADIIYYYMIDSTNNGVKDEVAVIVFKRR